MARARIIRPIRREEGQNPFWISYADLMTALVMLFLVVMSISMVAIASRDLVKKKAREGDIHSLFELIESKAEGEGLAVKVNRAARTISFGKKARFAHDSFQLSAEARESLQTFVPLLLDVQKGEPGRRWLKRVHIEGFTDQTGTYLYNVNLSLNRAQAVVCTLFQAEMSEERRQRLKRLLIIDGATATSIKGSPEESRRVEVRLEFRQLGEEEIFQVGPEMELGRCAIRLDGAPPPPGKK